MPFLRERSGRWSPEKIAAFAIALFPAFWIGYRVLAGDLGPRPLNELTHETGSWSVRLLLLALAISPARRIFAASRLVLARRTLGVGACFYIVAHLFLYIYDQHFNLIVVAREIVLRFYLLIGAVALLGMVALAATSWDGAVRRLGAVRWSRLHRLVYPIAVLAIVHFILQAKLRVYEPMMMAGFLFWLFGYRLVHKWAGQVTRMWLFGLAFIAALLTALAEYFWYALATGVDASRVLAAYLDPELGLRPAEWVLIVGLAVAFASLPFAAKSQGARSRRTAAMAASGATQVQSGS
jgi:sulfoxide reductase heme-binding subunit YedZ